MNIMRLIVEYVGCFLEIALAAFFFSSFQEKRCSKKIKMLVFLMTFIVYGSAVAFLPTGNIIYAVSIIATLAVAFCYNFTLYTALFMSLVFSVISALSELVVMRIITVGGKSFEEVNANFLAYVGGLLASKMITYLVLIVIRKKKYRAFQSVKGIYFIGLLMLPCSSVIMSMVYSYLMLRYPISRFLEILSILALIFLLISNAMIFYIVDKQYELISSKEKLKMSEVLLENQKQYYEDVFQSQQEIRKTRHDLKNIFIALTGVLNTGNTVECKKIIQNKLDELEQYIDFSNEADNMLDSILYSKTKEAQNQNVSLNIKKSLNRPILIDNLDLAVLVANILDNAIEAASIVNQSRTVKFSILTEQDSLIILSKNTTANTSVNPNMKTTKKDKKHHGFGLMSIKSITEKYAGSYNLEYDNGLVIATAVLTNKM